MAKAIEDQSCRDRPIYVRVTWCKNNNAYCWYVIEEKPLVAESSSSSSPPGESSSSYSPTTSSSSDNDEKVCNNDLYSSICGSDIIRRLSVPNSELRHNSLAVLKSHIYLIGGDSDTVRKNKDEEDIGYRHIELGKSEWQLGGGRSLHKQFGAAGVGHDGFIYSVGYDHQYRMSPEGGIEKLPTPPAMIKRLYESHLLALTETKLFIYVSCTGPDDSNLMFSYDLEKGKWDEETLYPNFSGVFSAGVVLYDRYLFSFGSQDPTSPAVTSGVKEVRKVVPGIYVFDITRRKWLPEPVDGLRTDGTVLPNTYETHDYKKYPTTDVCVGGPGYSPYLLQIGKQNYHKLALLWDSDCEHSKSGLPQCKLNWFKFMLNCNTNVPVTGDKNPHFHASLLSNGSCALDEWTDQLYNCAAGM